ncbi:DUF1707 domain-containing protein [Nocardioides salsibiostraticola]
MAGRGRQITIPTRLTGILIVMRPQIDPWASFAHDPRDPALGSLRAADADRDLVRAILATAYAEGRLSRTEFDERSDGIGQARLLGDLPPLIRDLIPGRPITLAPLASATDQDLQGVAEVAYRTARRRALLAFLGPTIICWAIWGAIFLGTGDLGFMWPLIVMAATLVGFLRLAIGHEEWVAEEVRRLEKKRAKQLKGRNRQRIFGQIRDQIAPPRRDRDHEIDD